MRKIIPTTTSVDKLQDWQIRLRGEAMKYAQVLESNFNYGLDAAFFQFGDNTEKKIEVVITFIDVLIVTTTGICAESVNDSETFEEKMIHRIRETFAKLRKPAKKGISL